jgi:AcrR family transcriptional regulator
MRVQIARLTPMGRPRTVADEEVLAAAAAAIGAIGPAAVTLAEIGSQVGLAPATLIQRFGSKRGVLLAVARHSVTTLPALIQRAADAPAPAAALVDCFADLAGGITTSAQYANHLAFLLLDLGDPDFQQVSRDYAYALEVSIGDVLDASRAAGELRADTDQTHLPRAVHAAYNGALVTWGMTADGTPAQQVRDQLTALLTPHLQSRRPLPTLTA